MKRIVSLLTLLTLVLTFAACSPKEEAAESSAATGSESGNAEQMLIPTLLERDRMKIACTVSFDSFEFNNVYSYLRAGAVELTYIESDNGVEQYFVGEGKEVDSYMRVLGQSEFTKSGFESDDSGGEVAEKAVFAQFGFDCEDAFESMSYEEDGEEKVGEYDCTVYNMDYTLEGESVSRRVWADKESGIWVKSVYTMEGTEYTVIVTEISDDVSDMPGTVPVSVSSGQIYSQDGLTLNLKGIEFDPTYAATLKLEAVNSTDSALKVGSKYFDVNGLCIGGRVFSVSVPAEQNLEFDVCIPDKSCEMAGIDMIEEMEFAVSAEKYHTEQDGEGTYDVSDGMLTERSDAIKITAVCPFEPEEKESGDMRVLHSGEDFDLYFGGIRANEMGGYDFIVYYESAFSEDVRVTVNIHEVNGEVYDDYEKVYVYSMRKGYGGFTLSGDKVIEEPADIKLSFEAYYGELYNGTCILEETEPFVMTLK